VEEATVSFETLLHFYQTAHHPIAENSSHISCFLPSSKMAALSSTHFSDVSFLGAFAQLQKATVSFAMSVCLFIHLSTYLHGITWPSLDRFL
jgi:hypothetical protein